MHLQPFVAHTATFKGQILFNNNCLLYANCTFSQTGICFLKAIILYHRLVSEVLLYISAYTICTIYVSVKVFVSVCDYLCGTDRLHAFVTLFVCVCLCVYETLRFALRLSEGICRVTLYSVCRSSSSAMKQASCTRRFALTICSLKRLRLLTNTTSLIEVRRIIMRDTGVRKRDNKEGSSSHSYQNANASTIYPHLSSLHCLKRL